MTIQQSALGSANPVDLFAREKLRPFHQSRPPSAPRTLPPRAYVHRPSTLEAHRLIVQRAITFMRAHLDSPILLHQLARLASTSKFHFVRVFEAITGTSPHRFLTCLRLQRAKDLLLNSNCSVMDICLDVGYSSHGTFSRTFTCFVGISPTEFRALARTLDHWELANRVRASLCRPTSRLEPEFSGEVVAPVGLNGSIFVGAFGAGVANSMPCSSTLLQSPGVFRFPMPAAREFQLMAVHIPSSARVAEFLCNPPVGALMATHRVIIETPEPPTSNLRLRPWLPQGPPPLPAMPALLDVNPPELNFAISEKRETTAAVMH
jgi:AraC family transcriptional regulator